MNDEHVATYVVAAAELHGLALDDERLAEVERQFRLLTALAGQFLELPLPAEIEPATVYRP